MTFNDFMHNEIFPNADKSLTAEDLLSDVPIDTVKSLIDTYTEMYPDAEEVEIELSDDDGNGTIDSVSASASTSDDFKPETPEEAKMLSLASGNTGEFVPETPEEEQMLSGISGSDIDSTGSFKDSQNNILNSLLNNRY